MEKKILAKGRAQWESQVGGENEDKSVGLIGKM